MPVNPAVWRRVYGLVPHRFLSYLRPLVLAAQAAGFWLLLPINLRALGRIALLLAPLSLGLLLLDLLFGLVALLIAILDYLLGDVLAAKAERYGRGKRNSTQQDQERRRYELRSYP